MHVTADEFRRRLTRRMAEAGAPRLSSQSLDQLERYFALLSKWNARINLTALRLQMPSNKTWDRLFIEPLLAARHLPEDSSGVWLDLGSGGGSPAIPLKIVRPALTLRMIEVKARKAAFLREATRLLRLESTSVENARFEDFAEEAPGVAQFVTVRAVRLDRTLGRVAAQLLQAEGQLLLFQTLGRASSLPGFSHVETVPLDSARQSFLVIYRRVFHVEHSARRLSGQQGLVRLHRETKS
jgi:16S rRNA (guanine527-N7)-methyltransferase